MATPNIPIPSMTSATTVPPLDDNWNLGEDGSTISMTDSTGVVYNLGKVLNFHVTPKFEEVSLRVLNMGGRELTQTERFGGKGEFDIARQDGTMEQLEFIQQQRKRAGQKELYFTIYQFVNNPNGTTNENMFAKCRVKLADPGSYELGKEVRQKVEFIYQDFIQVQ